MSPESKGSNETVTDLSVGEGEEQADDAIGAMTRVSESSIIAVR